MEEKYKNYNQNDIETINQHPLHKKTFGPMIISVNLNKALNSHYLQRMRRNGRILRIN